MSAVLKDSDEIVDIFSLPVFRDAAFYPMLPADELAEMAEDIQENGLREPLVIARVDGEWMLIDGRNRLAACKLAGITPGYRIIEAEVDKLKSLVWSWNGTRRHMTSSQKAMAYAMQFPETKRGMGSIALLQNCNNEPLTATDKSNISRARFILKNDPEKAELVRDGHPNYPLSKIYEAVKAAVEARQNEAEHERQKLQRLEKLQDKHSDLAEMVKEERLSLDEALTVARRRADEEEMVAKNKRGTLLGALSDAVLGARLFSHEDNAEQVLAILEDDQYRPEWNTLFPRGWVAELRDLKQAKLGIDRLVKVFTPVLKKKVEVNDEQTEPD